MSIDMGRYDIGVVDNQDGTYDITADWWGVETTKGVSEEEFKNQLVAEVPVPQRQTGLRREGLRGRGRGQRGGRLDSPGRSKVGERMRKQDIEIVINAKGEVTFEVKGVKGGSCLDETKFLEAGARRRRRGRRPAEDRRILRTIRGLRVDLGRGRQGRVTLVEGLAWRPTNPDRAAEAASRPAHRRARARSTTPSACSKMLAKRAGQGRAARRTRPREVRAAVRRRPRPRPRLHRRVRRGVQPQARRVRRDGRRDRHDPHGRLAREVDGERGRSGAARPRADARRAAAARTRRRPAPQGASTAMPFAEEHEARGRGDRGIEVRPGDGAVRRRGRPARSSQGAQAAEREA